MSNFTYASFDENGDVRKVHAYQDELTPEQIADHAYVPYVQDPYVFDETLFKMVGEEIVVVDGVAHKRAVVVPKDNTDKYRDALELRERTAVPVAERDEVVVVLLRRLLTWVSLQATPGKPETIFNITPQEVAALEQIEASLTSVSLPTAERQVPAPTRL